jgi:hypothetical protein
MTYHTTSTPKSALRTEVHKRAHLRERLLTEFPDLDDQTLTDTLDGCTNLKEMLAVLVRSSLDDEALASGLGGRLQDMKKRQERLEYSARKKRDLVLEAMSDAALSKVVESDFTVSVRSGSPTLEIMSEKDVPSPYWKPQPPKLDRLSLINALKSGARVAGAVLMPAKLQLSVRTK